MNTNHVSPETSCEFCNNGCPYCDDSIPFNFSMRPTQGVGKFKDLPNYRVNSKKDKERK